MKTDILGFSFCLVTTLENLTIFTVVFVIKLLNDIDIFYSSSQTTDIGKSLLIHTDK